MRIWAKTWLRRLLRAEEGSIIVLGALSLVSVIGMSSLAVEIGNGYSIKVRNQRVADVAALSAALSYKIDKDQTKAQKTATNVILANGLNSADADPLSWAADMKSVTMTIHTNAPVAMGSVLNANLTYPVRSSATASLPSGTSTGCINTLGTGAGVTISGGTTLDGQSCAVITNGSTNVSGGSTIKASQVVTPSNSVTGGSQIITSPTPNNVTTKANAAADAYSDNVALKAALCQVNKLNNTSDADYSDGNTNCTSGIATPKPVTPITGTDWTFGSTPSANVAGYKQSNGSYIVPVGTGTYTIGILTVSGSTNVTFQGPVTLNVQQIVVSGGTLTLPDGNLTISGATTLSGNVTVTVGNGLHTFGSIGVSGSSTLTVGSGSLNVSTKIDVSGNSRSSFAIGATDAVVIGADAAGKSISSTGSSILSFVPTGSTVKTSGFSAGGDIVASGTSGISINKADTHYVRGALNLSGGGVTSLGSGTYIVGGDFTISGGGSMSGVDVSIVMGGAYNLSGGTALNLAASASKMGTGLGIADIVIASKTSAGTNTSGGANTLYSGLVYLPHSALTTSGGSGLSSNGSGCMSMVVSKITMSGGSSLSAKACADLATSGSGSVKLIN